jgi:hypothetical protein
MLEVVVRMVLHGNQDPVEIGRLEIVNDESGDSQLGNYDVFLSSNKGNFCGKVTGFDRSRGANRLVREAMVALFPEAAE